ncbi:hypothetical protein F6X40_24075 [Paraburkholderia sp. UCT31]|nr:hypothetical protein [Paraburkholderia sp. UCT31]
MVKKELALIDFPPVEHKLVFGHLKHCYLLKSGKAKYQKRALEERDSTKQLLRYALLYNTYDRTAHVELYLAGELLGLKGFLARAWAAPKRLKEMLSGVPDVLVAERNAVRKRCADPEVLAEVETKLGVTVEVATETAFSAAPLVRAIEREWQRVLIQAHELELDADLVSTLSPFVSMGVSLEGHFSTVSARYQERWIRNPRTAYGRPPVKPAPEDWTREALSEYEPPIESWAASNFFAYFVESRV